MRTSTRQFLDGFATVRLVLEFDRLSPWEVWQALDPAEGTDPAVTPWRRGFNAAIRAAFGE